MRPAIITFLVPVFLIKKLLIIIKIAIVIEGIVTVSSTVACEAWVNSLPISEIVPAVAPVAIVNNDNDRIERAGSLAILVIALCPSKSVLFGTEIVFNSNQYKCY